MTSTQPLGTLCSVASLLAATLNQGNHDRNHNHWNIVSTEIDIPYASAVKVATYKWKVHNRKIEHISLVHTRRLSKNINQVGCKSYIKGEITGRL
jgi:hypothetical protein